MEKLKLSDLVGKPVKNKKTGQKILYLKDKEMKKHKISIKEILEIKLKR